MPQDSEAPKGRLILPQVQTIRDLLDNRCISINVTPETMEGDSGRTENAATADHYGFSRPFV